MYNNLSDIYDQTLQAQKRKITEKFLILVSKRLLEWQKELKSVEMSEFIYVDNNLMELKLIPHDIQFLTQYHLSNTRENNVQELINLNKRKMYETEKSSKTDAANLLKIHEKARQTRVLLTNLKMHPENFKMTKHKIDTMSYDFNYSPRTQPLFKVKRTKFERDCSQGKLFLSVPNVVVVNKYQKD